MNSTNFTKESTRTDFLIYFRRAKSEDTLSIMVEGVLRKLTNIKLPVSVQAECYLAYELRQDELSLTRF